jgi:pimeloyl-ACP methyl ester carboxylesterase
MLKTAAYNGKNLSYQISGTGPVVVLVHGFGEDGTVWKNQADFLSSSFCVIVPHLPGSSTSELIDDMSMESMSETIYFILMQEVIKKCTMIGHSMGGYITLAFAEKYPSLLEAYGLFHSTAFADTEEKKKNRKEGIQKIKDSGAAEFLKNFIPNLYGSSAQTTHSSIIQDHIKNVSYFSEAALISYYQSMMERPDRTGILKQNKMPLLFVLGRKDAIIPIENALKLATIPDIVYIHVLENSGHMGMIEEPEKTNNIIYKFLLKTI